MSLGPGARAGSRSAPSPPSFRSRPGPFASPRTHTAPTSPGRRTSRSAATSSGPTAAGPHPPQSSSGGFELPDESERRATGATSPSRSASTRRPAATARGKELSRAQPSGKGSRPACQGPGGVGVDVGLLDLLADALEQLPPLSSAASSSSARALAQPPEEPELLLGDPELDLVVIVVTHSRKPGLNSLPQRDRVVLAWDGGQEALVELDDSRTRPCAATPCA